jgi:uncharacterized repeat protein (TIGR04138 family)
MPKRAVKSKSLQQIAREAGYPLEAFEFVHEGIGFTAKRLFGETKKPRHISGAELAEGLRQMALERWGMLARTVLERWGVVSTMDFGRIVYALIDAQMLARCDDDSLEDFRGVYDFRKAFEAGYRIKPDTVNA